MVATVAGGAVAFDQGRQMVGRQDEPAGVRVLAPELLPMGPWDGVWPNAGAPEENLAAGRRRATLPVSLELEERVSIAAALKATGYRTGQIATALGVSVVTVRTYLAKAREWGALNDVARDLRTRALPQAVENLIRGLDKGDKDYTLETLKGMGEFVRKGAGEKGPVAAGPTMALQVTFVNAPTSVVQGHEVPPTANGMVVGCPRE